MLNWRDPHNPKSGGAERVSFGYLHALLKRGHEVCWFANMFPGARPMDEVDGITIVRAGGYGSSVLAAKAWYRKQPKFDLVIDQHHGIPWFAPWWCRTHALAYIHEVLGPIWRSFYRWPMSAIGQFQERWTHRLYRNIPFWVPSQSTATALHQTGVKSVTVIPNGCDTTPLPNLPAKPLERPLRLCCVSRLAPNKRVDHAIRAVENLKRLQCPVQLAIIGGGESAGDLKQLVGTLKLEDCVRFTGGISEQEKNRELQNAHFLVHTSVREGWGLNVLEANALGTPAVVYPVGGLVDSTVSGKTGIVTDSEEPENLANHLIRLSKEHGLYARLRRNGWERSKKFQWQEILPRSSDWLEARARGEQPYPFADYW